MARHVTLEREVWRVTVPAHVVCRRSISGEMLDGGYAVPASVEVQHEKSKRSAIRLAVTAVHVRNDIPTWRTYLRDTAERVTVERAVESWLVTG